MDLSDLSVGIPVTKECTLQIHVSHQCKQSLDSVLMPQLQLHNIYYLAIQKHVNEAAVL